MCRKAFANFDAEKVARFTPKQIAKVLLDTLPISTRVPEPVRSHAMSSAMSETRTSIQVEHVQARFPMPFAEVVAGFKAATGALDLGEVRDLAAAGHRPEAIFHFISERAGVSGLIRFLEIDHGALLRLQGRSSMAVRFLVGHPLIAASLAQRVLATALYTPLSVLISEGAGETRVDYDRPSSLFAQFGDPEVMVVAADLDEKLGSLIRSIGRVSRDQT